MPMSMPSKGRYSEICTRPWPEMTVRPSTVTPMSQRLSPGARTSMMIAEHVTERRRRERVRPARFVQLEEEPVVLDVEHVPGFLAAVSDQHPLVAGPMVETDVDAKRPAPDEPLGPHPFQSRRTPARSAPVWRTVGARAAASPSSDRPPRRAGTPDSARPPPPNRPASRPACPDAPRRGRAAR